MVYEKNVRWAMLLYLLFCVVKMILGVMEYKMFSNARDVLYLLLVHVICVTDPSALCSICLLC